MHFNKKENPTMNTPDTTTSKYLSPNNKLRTLPCLHVTYSPTPSIFAVRSVFNVVILFRSNPTTRPELPSFFSCITMAFKGIPRLQPRLRACLTVDQSLTVLTIWSAMSWQSGTSEQKKLAEPNLAMPIGRVTPVTQKNDSKKVPIASKQIKRNRKRK